MPKTIPQLTDATNVNASDELIIQQSGITKRATRNELMTFAASGTPTQRLLDDRVAEVVNVKDFGAVGDGVADDTAAIQAAISHAESRKGGTVLLANGIHRVTSTINIGNGYGVVLAGRGGDGLHDGGSGAGPATTLAWHGSAGGTVINVSSPSGSGNSRQFGSGVCDVLINCNTVAGIGLLVTSVRQCNFSRITILRPTIAGVKTTTVGNDNLAESSDIQDCVFDRIAIRCIDNPTTRAAHGFWLTSHSPIGSNSNTSFNEFRQCNVQMWGGAGSGHGLFLEDCDNCRFVSIRLFRAGGTAVEAVRIVGNTNCDANHFWNLSAGGANSITIKGVDSGFVSNPRRNTFWATDVLNGTQYPSSDAGIVFGWHTDNNSFSNQMFSKLLVGDSETNARNSLPNLASASLYIQNASENHVRLHDGTNAWGINIGGANDDFRITRLAGTGSVNLGAPLLVNGHMAVSTSGLLQMRSYTVATLPTAATAGQLIYVSDGTSNKRCAVSDGSNWRFPDGNIVS